MQKKAGHVDIEMYGCRSCNMNCKYCMGGVCNNDEDFILNKEAVKETIAYLMKCRKNATVKDFAIWGGEPTFHFSEFKKCVSFFKENFSDAAIGTSTNGTLFLDDEKVDYIISNRIKIQLSHDGVGQYVRSGNFDPLYDKKSAPNAVKIAKAGLLYTINCLHNKYNPSPLKNIEYFDKWIKENDLEGCKISIRLNHLNDSSYTEDYNLTGESLMQYIHETELLALKMFSLDKNDPFVRRYGYFTMNEIKNAKLTDGENKYHNSCGRFFSGVTDYNFALDTKGKFVCCNLIDSGIQPKGAFGHNKEGIIRPEYCKGCKYYNLTSCTICPTATYPSHCEYKKEFARMVERIKFTMNLIQSQKKEIPTVIYMK